MQLSILRTESRNGDRTGNVRAWPAALLLVASIVAAVWSETLVFPPYRHSYGIRKATPKHLFMFFGPRTFFDDPQGLATAKMRSRDDPSTENDDDEVVVYGVNSGRHQIIYNTSMWSLALFGSEGSGKDEFKSPRGIACDVEGNVYVVDAGNNRVVHLFNPKRKVSWVKAFDGAGEGIDGLQSPEQVGLDENGLIYVTDAGNRRIVVFDKNGAVQRIIEGGDEGFENGPSTIAVADGSSRWSHFRGERFLFCADRNGARLWKIGLDGNVRKTVNLPAGYHAAYGAADYYHNLWVTDTENHCVLKFDHNLTMLDRFGEKGTGDNQFMAPRGIAIWKRYGQTFIAEKKGAQYYWIGADTKALSLRLAPDTKRMILGTALTEYSYVTVFSLADGDTTTLLKKRMIHPGPQSASFPVGKIPPGRKYIVRIEPTYSSYTYYKWEYAVVLAQ